LLFYRPSEVKKIKKGVMLKAEKEVSGASEEFGKFEMIYLHNRLFDC
jgi:hypothetical protein